MPRRPIKHLWPMILFGVGAPILAVLFFQWRQATDRGAGRFAAEPFRIAGNLYYVGTNDVTSYLLTGPDGHVLIDGGYAETPRLIIASIKRLGFDIKDVKVLLNSEPTVDHAGGLAVLQAASGAELWASEASAEAISSGGVHADNYWVFNTAMRIGFGYPPARVDHRFKDGEVIRRGPIELTAHITGGRTRGCTTWTFAVRDGDRLFNVVDACSLELPIAARLVEPEKYPGIRADYERTFDVLRSLPEDIWVTAHAKDWGRYRKYVASTTAKDPAGPFIDREGYRDYIADGEAKFQALLAEQQGQN